MCLWLLKLIAVHEMMLVHCILRLLYKRLCLQAAYGRDPVKNVAQCKSCCEMYCHALSHFKTAPALSELCDT